MTAAQLFLQLICPAAGVLIYLKIVADRVAGAGPGGASSPAEHDAQV